MKCIITKEETKSMCNNKPLSVKGRKVLDKTIISYNNKIREAFVEAALEARKENGTEEDLQNVVMNLMDEDELRSKLSRLAPKVNRKTMLDYIERGVEDAIETLNEVFTPEDREDYQEMKEVLDV